MAIDEETWKRAIEAALASILEGLRPEIERAHDGMDMGSFALLAGIADDVRTMEYLDMYTYDDSVRMDYADLLDAAGVEATADAVASAVAMGAREHMLADADYFIEDDGEFSNRASADLTVDDIARAVADGRGASGLLAEKGAEADMCAGGARGAGAREELPHL